MNYPQFQLNIHRLDNLLIYIINLIHLIIQFTVMKSLISNILKSYPLFLFTLLEMKVIKLEKILLNDIKEIYVISTGN